MTNRKLFALELDISAEYPTSDLMVDVANFGLIAELVDANGPGGGNPVYKFSSFNKDDLVAFALECGYEDDIAEEIV
jgi:hypothetical protein